MNENLATALNEIRNSVLQDNKLYQSQVPYDAATVSSESYGSAILSLPTDMRNRFVNALVDKISYTQIETKYFNNPLSDLENQGELLGAVGEELYINPVKAREYDPNDFLGLLAKYEIDVKSQFYEGELDLQYPVTIIRQELQKAFRTWASFEKFISGVSASMYNGAFIDSYNLTRSLPVKAYYDNGIQMIVVNISDPSNPTAQELENLTVLLQELYLNMQIPLTSYNAWKKVGGYGYDIISWSEANDIMVMRSTRYSALMNVKVLADAFNMDKTNVLGKVYNVENFNYGSLDGSKIIAFIGDKKWFRIDRLDMFMDEDYNANNRAWNRYLNKRAKYNYSFFANGVLLVTEEPTVNISTMNFRESEGTVEAGGTITAIIDTKPFQANQTISVTSSSSEVATAAILGKVVTITGVGAGTATITATAGNVTATYSVTVTAVSNNLSSRTKK